MLSASQPHIEQTDGHMCREKHKVILRKMENDDGESLAIGIKLEIKMYLTKDFFAYKNNTAFYI